MMVVSGDVIMADGGGGCSIDDCCDDVGLLFYSHSSDSAPQRLRFIGRLAQLVGGSTLLALRLGDQGPVGPPGAAELRPTASQLPPLQL